MLKLIVLALMLLLTACRREAAAPTATPVPVLPTSPPTVVLPTPTSPPVTYIVQAGDSLSAIATRFDVPVEAISEANGIQDPNMIRAGQELIIPGPTPIPTATVLPTITPTASVPPQLEITDVIGRGAPTAETVVIVNRGRGVSLQNWRLQDAQGNVFIFPNLYLGTGAEVRIHTTQGENTPQHLYWNRDKAVWEEPGDTAILADERGVMYATKQLN
jgi:LysM repeat protein